MSKLPPHSGQGDQPYILSRQEPADKAHCPCACASRARKAASSRISIFPWPLSFRAAAFFLLAAAPARAHQRRVLRARDQIIRLAGNGALHMGAQLRNRLGCFGPGHLHVAGKYDGFAVKRVGGVCIRVCLHVLQGCTLAGKGRVAAVCRAFRFPRAAIPARDARPVRPVPTACPGTDAAAPSPPKAGACISRK